MKKVLFLLLVLLGSMQAQAQSSKHEISLAIGAKSLLGELSDAIDDISGSKDDSPRFTTYVQYLYNLNSHFGIGAVASLENLGDGDHGYTLMPVVRAYWFNKEHFGMYSRVGVGIVKPNKDDAMTLMWDLSPVGLDFGSEKVRGFVEGPTWGGLGVVNAGVKFSF